MKKYINSYKLKSIINYSKIKIKSKSLPEESKSKKLSKKGKSIKEGSAKSIKDST